MDLRVTRFSGRYIVLFHSLVQVCLFSRARVDLHTQRFQIVQLISVVEKHSEDRDDSATSLNVIEIRRY